MELNGPDTLQDHDEGMELSEISDRTVLLQQEPTLTSQDDGTSAAAAAVEMIPKPKISSPSSQPVINGGPIDLDRTGMAPFGQSTYLFVTFLSILLALLSSFFPELSHPPDI